jgi:four helix bundle protein
MRRAVLSVVANVAEGFEHDGNRESLNFLAIAKGSACEIKAHAYVALEGHIISEGQCNVLVAASTDFCTVAGGLMRYLRSAPLAYYSEVGVQSEDTPLEIPPDQFRPP